ncbi:MAG: DUF1836 domain-containing protein [Erysipelotrichaceae bacterium]|nr:DUF1836 domain-containing protein [Erysipelotrichaceae bacterium]
MEETNIQKIHIPRWEELPNFPLYIDQVVSYIEDNLGILFYDEKIITNSMINNYVKHGIVNPPVKKKYNRIHIAYFIVVCILKQSYSLQEISQLIQIQIKDFPTDQSYNYFCEEIEACIRAIINQEPVQHVPSNSSNKEVVYLLHNTVLSVTHKIYVQYYLNINEKEEK